MHTKLGFLTRSVVHACKTPVEKEDTVALSLPRMISSPMHTTPSTAYRSTGSANFTGKDEGGGRNEKKGRRKERHEFSRALRYRQDVATVVVCLVAP